MIDRRAAPEMLMYDVAGVAVAAAGSGTKGAALAVGKCPRAGGSTAVGEETVRGNDLWTQYGSPGSTVYSTTVLYGKKQGGSSVLYAESTVRQLSYSKHDPKQNQEVASKS